MRSLWRKVCGLALGAALLPSLAGGGACLEHAVHSLGGGTAAVAVSDVHAGHSVHDANAAGEHGDHVAVGSVVIADDQHKKSHAPGTLPAHSVTDGSAGNCCPASGAPAHCAGAAGCSVTAISHASELTAPRVVASRAVAAVGALARPSPSRAPDVPPPRA